MVKIYIGNYLPKSNELVTDYRPDIIYKNNINKGLKLVFYAEACRMKKEDIRYVIDNATIDITIVCIDETPTKGLRRNAKFEIIKDGEHTEKINDFELAKIILTITDRDMLLGYFLERKPNLYFITKVLTSNYAILTETNKSCLRFLDKYLWKVDVEQLYHFVAKWFKPQQVGFLKWNFPKKNTEETENAS